MGLKVEKDSFSAILRDVNRLATVDGRKVLRKTAGVAVVKMIHYTPQYTGMAASAFVPAARALRVTPPSIRPTKAALARKGAKGGDRRKEGEEKGRYEEKKTKNFFKITIINSVPHFWIVERKQGKRSIARALKEARREFAPTFGKAVRASRGKIGRKK